MKIKKTQNFCGAIACVVAMIELGYKDAFDTVKTKEINHIMINLGKSLGINDENFYLNLAKKTLYPSDIEKINNHLKQIISSGKLNKIPIETNLQKGKILIKNTKKIELLDIPFKKISKTLEVSDLKKIKIIKLISHSALTKKKEDLASAFSPSVRVYGIAFVNKDESKQYDQIVMSRKQGDHREINKYLKIFDFNKYMGQGFPIWSKKGVIVKDIIKNYVKSMDQKYRFTEVSTPIFGDKKLYEISEHIKHYKESMFNPIKMDNEVLMLRPMMCPHHILLYKKSLYSYKELPIRFAEHGLLFRYEKSGALTGLERVRMMELADAHIFLSPKQIEEEILKLISMIKEVFKKFEIKIKYVSLSLNDVKQNKYFEDAQLWKVASEKLEKALIASGTKYEKKYGEAAFYGPKIDFQVETSIGHEITLSTIQLDFFLPKKFKLFFIDENQKKQVPVLIHRGLIGTYERFISIILEQHKGLLPFWLSPKQIVIMTVSRDALEYAQEVYAQLKDNKFRVELNARDEPISKKIKKAWMERVNYQVVIGKNEMKQKVLSVKKRGTAEKKEINIADFLRILKKVTNSEK